MRIVRGIAAAALLVWLMRPEVARYRSERILRVVDLTLRYVVRHPTEVSDPSLALDRIATAANAIAGGVPGDSRPWILAGSARLVNQQADLAIIDYQEATERGERAETDLNLGRAYTALGDRRKSGVAFVRAAWISPLIIGSISPDVRPAVENTLAVLKTRLRSGQLRAPPPRP